MDNNDRILADILSCIDRINEQLPRANRIAAAESTVLVGVGGLESLTLINLVVEIEEAVSVTQGRRVSLLEEALMGSDGAKFTTVGDLAQWIAVR